MSFPTFTNFTNFDQKDTIKDQEQKSLDSFHLGNDSLFNGLSYKHWLEEEPQVAGKFLFLFNKNLWGFTSFIY